MFKKHKIRKFLRKCGFDIYRFDVATHPIAWKKAMLKSFSIDTVIDVGANAGQFAMSLRDDIGYTENILSFEPQSAAFKLLKTEAERDPKWEVFNFGLGNCEQKKVINIAGNSCSSSMLKMLPSHIANVPESEYVGTEKISLKTLDSIYDILCKGSRNVYLKIDTQGYEAMVIEGAQNSLLSIDTVEMEMSLIPLYEDELLFDELYAIMLRSGYTLVGLEKGFSSRTTGQILQVNGIFRRFE